jgi:hypothetical protein
MNPREIYRLYSVEDLVELKDDPSKWIVPNMIPRVGRVIVYGVGSAYKSSVMFDTSIAVASGGALLERMPVVRSFGPVILLSCEGSIYTNRDRLMAFMRSRNVLPSSVRLFYGQQPLELRRDEGANALTRMVELIRPAMVVIDPLVSFFGGNENDTEQVTAFTRRLDKLIQQYEFALVIIHHANKASEIRGSSALQAWTDGLIKLELTRNAEIPSFPEKKDLITVRAEKQRDGEVGCLFSAVPFFDKELRMTTFGVFDTMDAQGVILAHLRNEILKLLRQNRAALSKPEIGMGFPGIGAGRIGDAVNWLTDNGLVEHLSPKESGRTVECWKVSPLGTRIDAVHAILRAVAEHEQEPDADIAESG